MDFIELGYEYSLGVPELDKQHKELADQLNDTIRHCTGKKADERKFFDKNSKKSIDFMKYHFETEEKWLSKIKYDQLGKHKAEHKEMLKKVKKINDDVVKNRVELDLFYITAFIKEMVIKHIKTYDLSAKKYFLDVYEKGLLDK